MFDACCHPTRPSGLGRRAFVSARVALLNALFAAGSAAAAERLDATTTITGELTGILLVSVPLAFVVSIILLALYLRAVKRSMLRRTTPRANVGNPIPPASDPPSRDLRLVTLNGREALDDTAIRLTRRAAGGVRRTAAITIAGGLAFAMVMTLSYLIANGIPVLPFRFLYLAVSYAWPIVLTVGLVACISWRGWLAVLACYAAVFAAVVIPSLNEKFTPLAACLAWIIQNGPATILVLVFLARPVRAVGPMVMAFMFAAISGVSVAVHAVGATEERIAWVANAGGTLGLDGRQTFIAVMLIGFVLLGIAGWFILRLIGRMYQNRRISDQTLMIDSLWLMFAINHGIDMVFAGPVWFLAPLGAFAAYKFVTWGLFTLVRPDDDRVPVDLLLLRVFSLGKRSERLFNGFAKSWQHAGTIRMIAGPDLATTTIEPHEFLGFLTGQIDRSFIDSPKTLDRRLAETEPHRDRDGRYRVGDFFCHDDTWKAVLHRLADESQAVLMDLRGFTQRHKGCAFEIHELLNVVPLGRIVLVVDATTDHPFLRETLLQSWKTLATGSPNRHEFEPRVRLFPLATRGPTPGLIRAIAAAADGPPADLTRP